MKIVSKPQLMNKILGLYFFALLFQIQAIAQQFVFPGNYYHTYVPYYYTSFDNRYFISYDHAVTISDAKVLKKNRVKKVLVYSPENTLAFSFELDTAGKVWRYGQQGNYFTVNSDIKSDDWDKVNAISYYEQSYLVRSDTTFIKYYDYKNKDTVMHFERSKKRVYKIGYLVNEQNAYYNKKFYNKVYKGNSYSFLLYQPIVKVNSKGQIILTNPNDGILLHKKLKTNYDSTHLYYCSEENQNDNFYASKNNGNKELQLNKLNKHKFGKNFYSKIGKKHFISGENFNEPVEQHESMWCGNSLYYQQREMQESINFSNEVKYNDKGLCEAYYQLYYHVDTSIVKKETKQEYDSTAQKAALLNIQSVLWPYSGARQPRSPNPVKTLVYYIRYEYFEYL